MSAPHDPWERVQRCGECSDGTVVDHPDAPYYIADAVDAARAADSARHQAEIEVEREIRRGIEATSLAGIARYRERAEAAEATVDQQEQRIAELLNDNRALNNALHGARSTVDQQQARIAELEAELAYRNRWAESLGNYLDENHDSHGSDMAWDKFLEVEHEKPPVFGCECARCRQALETP